MNHDEIMAMSNIKLEANISRILVAGETGGKNWATDLSAAWELEESIPFEMRMVYASYLRHVIAAQNGKEDRFVSTFALIHATPKQRCCAFLMWKVTQ